jgi:hypothetical protein
MGRWPAGHPCDLTELFGVPFHFFDMTHHQHPSRAVAGVRGCRPVLPCGRTRREIHRGDRALRDGRVLPVNDRVVVFDGHGTHHDAMLEGPMQSGRPDAGAGRPAEAQHWLATKWPLLELQRSLPDVFPSAGRHADREIA